jgi:hypothetical protein
MPTEVCRKIKVEIEQWKVAKLCGQSRGIVQNVHYCGVVLLLGLRSTCD